MREKNFTFLINKLVGVFSLMLILILSSACQKEETECILFCQGSPKVSFLTNSQGVNENVGTVRVYVKVDPAPVGSFQINYSLNTALTTASASDYAFIAGTLNFSSGETSKYFEFIVTNDTEGDEGNEYVSFKLGYPTDGELGDYSTITYAIIDNDVTDITVAEGATQTSVVLSCDDGSGTTETFNITTQSDPDSNCTLTSAPVRVSCTPNYKNDHTDWSSNISVDCTQGGVTTPISFTVDVTDTNQAPTATTMGALTGTGAQSGFGVSITYADIMTAIVDETDAEGDTLYLKIDSVDDGTLTLNGSAVSEGVSYMTSASPNNSVVWTPSSSAQGSTAAFKVSVYDGSLSSNSLTVTVDDVFNFKSPTAFAAPEGSKTAGTVALDCNDGSGTTPTFSYISESATPSLNCGVTNGGVPPSYIECTPAYKSGQANWSGTITVRCNIGGTTVDQTATIIATNTNRAPTLTGFTTLTGGATGTAYTISYATMVDKANDDAGLGDADNDTINFRVESILGSGTLTKSGVPVVAGTTTVSNGESLVYTPGDSDIGTTSIFTIVAYDGISVSAAPITVNLEISGVSALPDVTVTENDVWQSPLLVCDDGTGGTPFYDITAQSDPLTNCSIVGSRISCNPVQYKAGQLSWSSDITLECDVDNTGTGQIYRTFTMTVNNLNRKPTLTGMTNITGATFGNPFTISYADLTGAATSFADSDGDTLHFRIEGVPEGTLTKNGSAVVPGTTLISTGEEVVWTPETNSVGVTTMFNVVAYDGTDVSTSTIPVRTSLDGITIISDLTTSENVLVESPQVLCADSTGTSTAFSISYEEDTDANCSIPSDKVRCTPSIKAGQSSWTSVVQVKCTGLSTTYTRNFVLNVDNTNQAPTLTSVSNLQGAVVNTDYTITHTYLASRANESDGDSDPISFKVMSVISGTLKKNGAVVTPGTTMIEDGEQFVWTPGTDNLGPQLAFSIVANDGTVDSTANVDVNVEIAGFLGMADITVAEAATYNSSNLEVNSICNDGANGAKDVTYVSAVDTDANCSEAAGVITCNPNAKSGQSDWSTDVTIRCNTGGTDYDHTFTINVTNANQPPTLTSFSNFVDHDMDTTLTVSYGDLDIKGDANDLDGDPLVYKIVQVPYGTMTKGGSPIVEGTTTIAVGEEVVWTPNSGIIGEVPIMQLKVSDGFNENTNGNIAINAEVRGFTTLADVAATENVQALSAIMTCDDGTSAVGGPYNGAYSILIESDTDSNCSIDGSDRLDCTPAYKNGQSDWSSTITIQCNANSGAEIFSQTVDVNVTNANQAPTLTTINQFAGAVAEVPFTFTHAALLANATDENDPDGLNSQLQFRIETLDNGTLTKGGTAITEGVTLIGPGESVVWTPAATTNGDTTAFTVVAYDGNDASSGSVDVIADRVVYLESLADQTFTEGSVQTSAALTCTDGVATGTMTVTAQTDTQSRCSINGSDQLECDPFYDDGSGDFSNNWSSDVTIECTGISTIVDQTLTVNVTNVNRAPTLSGVTNFVGAISNEQYVITYANLLANAIVTDADTTDDIGFKIVNVNSGTLTLGGSPVVEGTTILTSGQQLEWTSALSAVGDVVAFTIAANDGTADSATATVTMASIFNFPDISDLTATENSQSLSSALICSNGTGLAEVITIPSPPADTSCSIDGSNRIDCTPDHRSGQSDWSETVVVRCEDGDNAANFATKSFTLNVNNLNRAPTLTNVTNFVGAQAGIPFNIAQSALITNANEADLDNDTVYFKIMGVTSGTLTKNGSPVIPNTTTFVDGETLVWTPTSTSQGTVAAFTIRALDGFADNGSDIQVSFDAVLRFDAIADISTTENTLQATATLVCDDGSGNSNSNFSLATTDADALCVLSSTTGAPVVNCTPAYKDGHANWSADITVTCESNGYSRDQTFTLSVTDANQAPTLTTITPMKRTAKDTDFSFTYADLLAASDANDGDSDPIKFRIESVEGSSVLKLNGIAVNPGTTLVQTGDSLTWTPPTGAIGTTNAFMIEAYDNTSFSGTDRQVSVHVIEFTDFADQAINEGASTNFGTLACADGSVDTPTYTLVSESDPASNCAIVPPTGLGCSPVHKPGQSSWTSDLVVRCTYGDGKYAEDNVQISVTNINRAPTMTTFDPVATSVKSNGTDFIELTYAQVAALGNEADEDGDTISFRIETAPSGTLEIDEGSGYGAVTPGTTTIDSGDTIKWTPDADTAGDTIAATIVAFDGADPSTPAQNLTINVFKFDAIGGLSVAEEATGLSSALVCSDGTATTPTYSITSQVDPAVNCSIVGTSLSCNPNFKTSHVGWSSDVTVECDISGKKYQRTTTVTVTEENQEPTMSSITTFTGAYSDTVYSITFAQLMAASDAADPESDPLDFLITSVNSGSLDVNGSPYAVTTNEILSPGQTLDWTPTGCTGTDLIGFKVRARDDQGQTFPESHSPEIDVVINCQQAPAVLSTTDTSNSYGLVAVNNDSADFTINISYAGEMPAEIKNVHLTPGFKITSKTCVDPGNNQTSSCLYNIAYQARPENLGPIKGFFTIHYNDGYQDQYTNYIVSPYLNATGTNAGVGTFTTSGTQAVNSSPRAIASANLDPLSETLAGSDDLVIANVSSNNISVLQSSTGPAFTRTDLTTGTTPTDVQIADINNDGHLDIVVVNRADADMRIFQGDSTGLFTAQADVPIGTDPFKLAISDLNGDGNLDVIVTDYTSNNVVYKYGNGDFTFITGGSVAVGTNPRGIAAGDFNNDGAPEVVVTNYNSANVSILENDGEGVLSFNTNISVGVNPIEVAVGNTNTDQHLDFVVANYSSGNVMSFTGNGSFGFLASGTELVGASPNAVSLSDVDNDGDVDLIVANRLGSGLVNIRVGANDGTFSGTANQAVGDSPNDVVFADINADGKVDIVTVDEQDSQVTYLIGD